MFARTMTLVLLTLSLSLALGCAKVEKPQAAKTETDAESATKAETSAGPPAYAELAAQPRPVPAAHTEAPEREIEAAKPPAGPTPSRQTSDTSDQVAQVSPAQPAAKPATKQPAPKPAAAKPPTKQEILNSPEWRRAMFEFSEWLTAQTIYTPAQVAQIKDQFNHRVAAMDAAELAYMLNDMEAKFHVMSTPEAREARAWMAQYLSVLSDRKRDELLKDVPNIATMTAAQLNAEIQRIIEKRQTLESEQSAFQRGQAAQVANQIQTDRTNRQNFVRDWNSGPATVSPYRNGSNVNDRLNNAPTGSGMGFYVSPWGGVGMTFSPSSW